MTTTAAEPAVSRDRPDMLHRSLRLTLVLCLVGFLLGLSLLQLEEEFFSTSLTTLLLFRNQDAVWLGLSSAVALLLYLYREEPGLADLTVRAAALWPDLANSRRTVGILAMGVLCLVGAGTYFIHHAQGFVYDEYMGELQAGIFLSGQLLAHHSEEWTEFARALFPYFLLNDAEHHLWGSGYRPVFAAIRAMFGAVSLGPLTNAVLTAGCILLVASIARKLWPERRDAAVLAAVLLATGPQLLFMGMTGYAWPAHLCLNLLWLRLFLRDDRLGHGFAALIGFAAVGLHQINPHPTFVLPFMISLLMARRWSLAAFYASTYSVALAVWVHWPDIAIHLSAAEFAASAPGGPTASVSVGTAYVTQTLSLISLTQLYGLPFLVINFLRLLAWQNLAVLPLILVALRPWSGVPPTVRLLVWGCVLTMIPYVLIMPNQMHSWGYRYTHGLLGSMVLIATFGWISVSSQAERLRSNAKQIIIGFTALAVLVGVPLRAVQVEQFVRPMAAANRYLHGLPGDLVVVDTARLWYEGKVIRNDPLLSDRPLVLSMQNLTADQLRRLCDKYVITFVTYEDLAPLGVPELIRPPSADPAPDGRSDAGKAPASEHSCPAS